MDSVNILTCENITGFRDFYYDGFSNIFELRDNKIFDTCYGIYILDPNSGITPKIWEQHKYLYPNVNYINFKKEALKNQLTKIELDRVKLFYAYMLLEPVSHSNFLEMCKGNRLDPKNYKQVLNFIFDYVFSSEPSQNFLLAYFLDNLEYPYGRNYDDYNKIQKFLSILNLEWCKYQLAVYDIIYPDDLFTSFSIFDGYMDESFGSNIEHNTIVGPSYDNQYDIINRLTIYDYNTCQTSSDE